jgi:hypothetical protein
MAILVIINIIPIRSIWRGIDSFIAPLSRAGLVRPTSVELQQAHDEPAAHFTDKHLGGLEDGLLEMLSFMDVGVVAITYALVVLRRGCV